MKNRNLKAKFLILVAVIIIIAIVFLMFYNVKLKNKTDLVENNTLPEIGNQDKPEQTTNLSDIKFELADYRVFKIDGVPFNFIIAKIKVTAPASTNISLDHFVTSENIKLNEVDDYVKKLENKSYYLGRQNVVFDLISNDSQYFANIFIPVKEKTARNIDLTIDFDNQKFSFDLNTHQGDANLLKYKADDIITDGKTYKMSVSSAFEITGETMSETIGGVTSEYLLPSTVAVYIFNLETVSLWGDVIELESAQYVTDNNDVFEALDSSISSMKYENILGKKIKDKDKGSLFFVAYNPLENPVIYKGVLKLKLKDSDTWITVNVDLN